MEDFFSKLGGPYFDFLVVNKDEYWERRGKVNRIAGIKAEYFHRKDFLRIQDCVISIFVNAFQSAHSKFNYYGYTIYNSEDMRRLVDELELQANKIRLCSTEEKLGGLLTELFISYYEEDIGDWKPHWEIIKNELLEHLTQIIEKAKNAQAESKELLVLGV